MLGAPGAGPAILHFPQTACVAFRFRPAPGRRAAPRAAGAAPVVRHPPFPYTRHLDSGHTHVTATPTNAAPVSRSRFTHRPDLARRGSRHHTRTRTSVSVRDHTPVVYSWSCTVLFISPSPSARRHGRRTPDRCVHTRAGPARLDVDERRPERRDAAPMRIDCRLLLCQQPLTPLRRRISLFARLPSAATRRHLLASPRPMHALCLSGVCAPPTSAPPKQSPPKSLLSHL